VKTFVRFVPTFVGIAPNHARRFDLLSSPRRRYANRAIFIQSCLSNADARRIPLERDARRLIGLFFPAIPSGFDTLTRNFYPYSRCSTDPLDPRRVTAIGRNRRRNDEPFERKKKKKTKNVA